MAFIRKRYCHTLFLTHPWALQLQIDDATPKFLLVVTAYPHTTRAKVVIRECIYQLTTGHQLQIQKTKEKESKDYQFSPPLYSTLFPLSPLVPFGIQRALPLSSSL